MATTRIRLVKITLLAAFEDRDGHDAGMEALGDQLAEMVRDDALTCASEYDSVEADIHETEDGDELADALAQRFPNDGLSVGPVPGVRVLGKNGTFKHARLERTQDTIQLWLGTPKEQYPLVSFPAGDDNTANYPVPAGKRRRAGVEYGCGNAECADCYEPKTGRRTS